MEANVDTKRFVRYSTPVGGPYFVKLNPKQAVDFYAEQREKGNPCEIMPEGYEPAKEELNPGKNKGSGNKMSRAGDKVNPPNTGDTNSEGQVGSGAFCGSCPRDSSAD